MFFKHVSLIPTTRNYGESFLVIPWLWKTTQYLVWPPYELMAACKRRSMLLTRVSSLSTGIVFHSSVNAASGWFRLRGLTSHLSTARCSSSHMCSMGFASGDLAGCGLARTPSSSRKVVVTLPRCGGALSSWKAKLSQMLREPSAASVDPECLCSGPH
jgi:hypothetical protein